MRLRRVFAIDIGFVVILFVLIVASLCIGKYTVSPSDSLGILLSYLPGVGGEYNSMDISVVIGLRLPRVIAAVLVGGALSVSGASYQGIFKNPLVSPDLLGVSAGACVGAAIAILLSLGSGFIQLFAFITGIIAVFITTTLPKFLRSNSNLMLVLSGIIIGGLMNSILGFIKYIADPETQLATITYWTMGDFSYIEMKTLLYVIPAIIIPLFVIFGISWWIDILSLGEREAQSLGANVGRVRMLVVVCATLLTASGVCIAGAIGWVGLVIPHFGRMIIGTNNTRLMPISFLLGGIFMLAVDTLTRVIGPIEMPISILTGVVGAPFYVWLLYKGRRKLK
jgi:iron complex transport system permease protein